MISRAHRFHGFNALRHVYAKGRTVRGPLLSVRFTTNDRRGSYRAAVVVSRKIHKSAVVRNRIRRRVYEILRAHEPSISQPYDIVITIFSDQVATIETNALNAAIVELLQKAGIMSSSDGVTGADKRAIVVPKEGQSGNESNV